MLEPGEVEGAKARQRDEIWNGIDQRVRSEDFFLQVEIDTYGRSAVPISSLAESIEHWLHELDPALVRAQVDESGLDGADGLVWEDEASGWELTLRPIPKKRHSESDRLVGLGGVEVGYMGDRAATRKAISKKYRRYGNDLGRPFVVALASNRIGLDHLDVNEALFGDEVYAFDRTDPSHGHLTRARNGVWIGKDGPRARRLSAVITADGIYPWSIATSNLVVWRNPWADRPFEPDLMNAMHVDLIADRFERTGPETSSADCFGLPHDWPGPEAGFEARG